MRKQFHIRGIVQGVGFRPHVFRLARRFRLAGFVCNTPDGVLIEVEGPGAAISNFVEDLTQSPPPLAEIAQVAANDLRPMGETEFVIQESIEQDFGTVLVSPDVATCDDCRSEFSDPSDRRFGYAFTNCTHCGPRYSIIQGVPYDRPATTMHEFRMCAECQSEYDDPGDRRFHAQPNACPVCGPRLSLVDSSGAEMDIPRPESGGPAGDLDAIREVRRLLKAGKIIAIKGLGGFHLACDAENHQAVERLRARKRRSDKPFALMVANLSSVERLCHVTKEDRDALLGPRHPIVILDRRQDALLSPAVSPDNRTLGVMLPYTPLHWMLFGDNAKCPPAFTALVMTSGNLAEEPIVISNGDALSQLGHVADALLLHNRRIHMRVDDSVVRVFRGKERVLRRSRGYVPAVIDLGRPVADILACGPELKNTFCLTHGQHAILSQHIGDLENYETLVFFEETLANLKNLFRIGPRIIAYDLHPHYLSTQYAMEQDEIEKIGVQHHHAHIASCMAENGLDEKVIGVAFDGTGYGTDGQIWGGEFLVADFRKFERRAHLRYIPLAGGDAAIRHPWRSGLSYLRETYGKEAPAFLPMWNGVPDNERRLIWKMLEQGINTVATSSCGRLFDAVASILGLRYEVNFEGQAAIALEMAAQEAAGGVYPFQVEYCDPWQIDLRPVIESIVNEVEDETPPGVIAGRFHNSLAEMITQVCRQLREQERLNKVCLSGGTFQNMLLLDRTLSGLGKFGFEVYLHAKVPPNDGGIALGQAAIANAVATKGG
ncbi:MAG: carbamoyltransferase HypF [Acidobacteria bacterium]|nr:MAG: carbamoyltransferase HypF [Acidobacteriota bacterium]